MMLLKRLYDGKWKVLALADPDGSCEVEEAIHELQASPKTKATGFGFVALWSRVPSRGPRELGTDKYHRVDEKNSIYEFIKGSHRLLCFEADGALIICSHVFRKSSKKTPAKEKQKAIDLRNEYLAKVKAKSVKIHGEGE